MSSKTISPYQTLAGRQLHLAPTGQLELRPDGSIDAQGIEDHFDLTLDCSLDLQAASNTISTDEDLDTACDILILAESVHGRMRECVLTLDPQDQQQIEIRLEKAQHRGVLSLTAVLVRQTEHLLPDLNRSGNVGAMLGASEPVRIHFDEPSTAPGNSLEIEWTQFAQDSRTPNQENHIFALDENAAPPKILLNSDIERLFDILNSTASSGHTAAVREAIFAQIAHQVWTSLITSALVAADQSKAESIEEGDPFDAESVLGNLVDWQQRILKGWATELVEEGDSEHALEILMEQLGDETESVLISQIPAAIQRARFTATPKKVEMLIRNLAGGS